MRGAFTSCVPPQCSGQSTCLSRMLIRRYNKREDDFEDKNYWDDYLEEREDLSTRLDPPPPPPRK